MSERLLEGVRVLDFTQFLAGPYCTQFLADMGAEVIKVENLKSGGDFVRNAQPHEPVGGQSMYFGNLNRNKKGVALDLKSPGGKELFSRLVQSADVLMENMRPGVMAKLGFGYEDCKRLNPGLIFASVSGFGQYGPYSPRPGYDLIAQAMGGSMSITGWPGSEPTRAGMAIGDLMAGMNACIAICASLYKRRETGKGQQIDVALVDTIVSGLEAKLMNYYYGGSMPEKTGNRYITSAPYDSYKAKDDYYVIASGTDAHFVKFSAGIGRPELAQDPRFHDTPSRNQNWAELKEIINAWSADKTAAQCVALIDSWGIPAAPIYNCAQVCADENITKAREMLVEVPRPRDGHEGTLTVVGNPIKMSEYPCRYTKGAPMLGEDNEDIFRSLGFTEEQLAAFRAQGAMN